MRSCNKCGKVLSPLPPMKNDLWCDACWWGPDGPVENENRKAPTNEEQDKEEIYCGLFVNPPKVKGHQ